MGLKIWMALLLCHTNLLFGQVSLKNIALENGKYSVGFRHYLVSDSTRTYKRIFDWTNQSIPRPIPVSMWYPSTGQPENNKIMTVLEYMKILTQEEEWEYLPDEQILNWFYYPNTPDNQVHLKEQTAAFHNIQFAGGEYPAIIYAPSYQASSIENFALCEYLASHGYIIISSPGRGTENRFLEGGSVKDIETQTRDLEFLIQEALKYTNTDRNKIATMGFSFGGLSNVLLQMRNSNIKAIISLDGAIKYQYATLKKSSFENIEKVNVPFIHMAQKDIPEQVLKEDNLSPELNYNFEFYDSLKYSNAYSLKFNNLTHSYFSTLGVLFQTRDDRQDKSDFEIMESYKWLSIYTLNFLDAYLMNNSKSLQFLENEPGKNGIKTGLISRKEKKPVAKPYSFEDFNDMARKNKYVNLEGLYSKLLHDMPTLKLAEDKLNNLGLQLVFNPQTSENGIRIFLFATTIYPNSANLFDSLAEAYLFMGNKQKAIESFEKSLSLNAENQNAISRLKELKY